MLPKQFSTPEISERERPNGLTYPDPTGNTAAGNVSKGDKPKAAPKKVWR